MPQEAVIGKGQYCSKLFHSKCLRYHKVTFGDSTSVVWRRDHICLRWYKSISLLTIIHHHPRQTFTQLEQYVGQWCNLTAHLSHTKKYFNIFYLLKICNWVLRDPQCPPKPQRQKGKKEIIMVCLPSDSFSNSCDWQVISVSILRSLTRTIRIENDQRITNLLRSIKPLLKTLELIQGVRCCKVKTRTYM